MDEVTPSHPNFDRSKLSDKEYIERLLFEIKELKSTLVRKDQLIQSLQGNGDSISDEPKKPESDIPQRSARRKIKESSADEQKLEPAEQMEVVPVSNSQSHSLAEENHLQKDVSMTSIQSDLSMGNISTSTSLDHPSGDARTLDGEIHSNRSSIYSDEGAKGISNVSEVTDETTPVFANDSTINDPVENSAIEDSALESEVSEVSEAQLEHRSLEEQDASGHLRPSKSSDPQNSANTSGIFQHKNHSASSFQSYRSRIKLPPTLQQQAQVKAASHQPGPGQSLTPTELSPNLAPLSQQQNVHHSPESQAFTYSPSLQQSPSVEPPRIPLPESPSKAAKNNVLLSGKSLPHSKTFKDLNIQTLKVTVPSPNREGNALRSPAVLNYQQPTNATNTSFPPGPHQFGQPIDALTRVDYPKPAGEEYKEIPRTPEAFYNSRALDEAEFNQGNLPEDTTSNMSSPVVPYSQYSQVSPATGYSYRGGLDYESESIRTPITTDFTSHDSIYNIRSASGSNRNLQAKNGGSNVMISNNSSYSVNRTMVNEDDGALFIKPEEFQTIALTVISTISNGNTQVQASTSSKRLDDIFITIAVNDRSTGKEMWRIKKSLNQLIAFDNEIRPTVEYFGLPVLPDKSLFFSTTPNKIDVRISGLQNYFNTLFVMPHIPHLILFRICKYLSLDFVNPLDEFKSGSRKEGYLVRKYKGLGTSWKVRWCQVDGPVLELYDQPGGSLLEQINLKHCQIGRQSNDSVAEDKGYRHAFLIMESHKSSKLSNSFPKHFFCAENDYERDEWVNALIDMSLVVDSNSTSTANSIKDDIAGYNVNFQTPRNYGSDYQDEPDYTNKTKSPVPSNVSYQTMDSLEKEKPTDKKGKKRSIFPFRTKGSNPNSSTSQLFDASNLVDSDLSNAIASSPNANSSFTSNSSHQNGTSATVVEDSSIQSYLDKMGLDEQVNKSIFGRELVQAYEISHHNFLGREVPSIIYRCIEFLLKTGAVYEEGIFRLSGSASTIRQLKEAFNKKFDLDLFENELKPDMHTVSGLLKTYLRELPSPIVSDKGYSDLRNIVMNNGNTAATSLKFKDYFNNLNNLDRVYYDTSYIVLKFLKEIINNKDSNKMNLRNVCIVFVPTLNISLDVMSLLLIDFNCIFEDGDPIPDNQREVLDLNIPSF